jgi:integrase/recombinase XerD
VDTYLTDFLDYLRVEAGLSPNTLAAYRRDISQFLEFLRSLGKSNLNSVRAEDVTRFLSHIACRMRESKPALRRQSPLETEQLLNFSTLADFVSQNWRI